MAASPARLAANRANAQRSSGPRTVAGKAASSTNATKHGLLARQPLLPGEDPAELDALTTQLLEHLVPEPGIEELLVDDIVGLVWRLRRLARVEVALYAVGLPEPVLRALGEAGEADSAVGVAFAAQASSFAVLNRYETALVHRLRRSLADLERLQAGRRVGAAVVVPIHAIPTDGFVSRSGSPQDAPRGLPGPSLETPEAPSNRYRESLLPEGIEKGGR